MWEESHLESPEGSESGRNPHHVTAVFGECGSELSCYESFGHTPYLEEGNDRPGQWSHLPYPRPFL